MLRKLFWEDPYQTQASATVQSVEADKVRLDQTIFFAFSGGQESDTGTIGGVPVLGASKEGHDIVYTLPSDHGLEPGQQVDVCIDWERRYNLMRNHFAAELILELIYKELGDIEKIGAHIAADKARIDFYWPQNISQQFDRLLTKASQIIESDLPIKKDFSDLQNQRRYWEIEGFSRVPCGGTHINSTREVGQLTLKRKNIGKGKERIEIYTEGS